MNSYKENLEKCASAPVEWIEKTAFNPSVMVKGVGNALGKFIPEGAGKHLGTAFNALGIATDAKNVVDHVRGDA